MGDFKGLVVYMYTPVVNVSKEAFFFFPVEFQLVSPLKKRPKWCKILFLNPLNCIYTEIVRKSVRYLRPFSISRVL